MIDIDTEHTLHRSIHPAYQIAGCHQTETKWLHIFNCGLFST